MNIKKMILARPSSFIVNEMTNMVEQAGLKPIPLQILLELDHYHPDDVGGVVVSSSTTSVVKESFQEVLYRTYAKFPGKPVFLASMIEIARMEGMVKQRLKGLGISRALISVSDAVNRKDRIDFNKELVVIQKQDLTHEESLQNVLGLVRSYCS